MNVINANGIAAILIDSKAQSGIKKVSEKSARDFESVTGKRPEIITEVKSAGKEVILYATVDDSEFLAQLEAAGKVDLNSVRGKREVYGVYLIENPFENVDNALVVCGSDKLGTIYGIFAVSEYIGVSPLVFWGDVIPAHKDQIVFEKDIETISKEPSVKYRGFFINDEWPCFGTWTMKHFGGFNAKAYDHVYELLLRLKGNYLWPAMWTSSFALDGPGEESAQLADEYGIYMGNSHHEPCLRASEEWDIYKVQNPAYGTAWDYTTNKAGLLEYWKDGLIRSGKYASIVTVGMRGERDSMMQGTVTLEDNINVLKDIIAEQEKLIREYGDQGRRHPRLLAVYKEVERYYYGDEKTPGLKDWEGLDDIILMFCEDNFGTMRYLPDESMRKHKGGFGMYYHFDYHGGPISYEWINSTPLWKVWGEMTKAYEYGVRDVWMVNVGDLKGNEFPLEYFMSLAYDYEKWGISNTDSACEFTRKWAQEQFQTNTQLSDRIAALMAEFVDLIAMRRPEALNPTIYHPVHYNEGRRILAKANNLIEECRELKAQLSEEKKAAFFSMVEHPLESGMNLIQMHINAALNMHYANQGKHIANMYADIVTDCIKKDRELSAEFRDAFDGKWDGMELARHIGFTKWNEDGRRYPLRVQVEPVDQPQLLVSRTDNEYIASKNYGAPDRIVVDDFCYMDNKKVQIEIANGGSVPLTCYVEPFECEWLSVDWTEKEVKAQEILEITCDRAKVKGDQTCAIYLNDRDTRVEILVSASELKNTDIWNENGVTVLRAEQYSDIKSTDDGQWKVLKGFGRSKSAVKILDPLARFEGKDAPWIEYTVNVEKEGVYKAEMWTFPSNPVRPQDRIRYSIEVNGENTVCTELVGEGYQAGETSDIFWCKHVLEHIIKNVVDVRLKAGENKIKIYAGEPGLILEKIIVYADKNKPNSSYLGPASVI